MDVTENKNTTFDNVFDEVLGKFDFINVLHEPRINLTSLIVINYLSKVSTMCYCVVGVASSCLPGPKIQTQT